MYLSNLLGDTLAGEDFDELALLANDNHWLLGAALEDELVALEGRAEFGERQDIDLGTCSLHLFANLEALLLAHLLLHDAILRHADSLVHDYWLANRLPNILEVVVHLHTLADTSFLRHLATHLVWDLLLYSDAFRLADLAALLERAVNNLFHLFGDGSTCGVLEAALLDLRVAHRLDLCSRGSGDCGEEQSNCE